MAFFVASQEAGNVPEYLLEENQLASPENVALFDAAGTGSVASVKTALADGGKVRRECYN